MAYVPLPTLETLAHKARRYDQLRARARRHETPSPRWLTQRRREVLLLTCRGLSRSETAAELGVSVETVKTHRENLLRLSRTRSTAGLALWAVRHGLVDPWADQPPVHPGCE